MTHDIVRLLDHALTVEELIDELKTLEPKSKVVFTCSYGDRGGTRQALAVSSVDEHNRTELAESGYSETGVALRDDDDTGPATESDASIVVLS